LPQHEVIREVDLAHALKNTGSAPQTGVATPKAPPKPATTTTSKAKKTAPTAKHAPGVSAMSLFGTPQDYQLVRAVDLVRGIAMFHRVAAAK
ncbi:MAG: hypothetical protein ACREE3_08355, partial [Stellaceae bacterium]